MADSIPTIHDVRLSTDTLKISKNKKISTFTIKSMTNEGVGYKIKTNRPKDYIVEPGIGILIPDQEVTINVKILNDNPTNKHEHRFKLDFIYFDWRKTVEELKVCLKDEKVKKLEKRMDVIFMIDETEVNEDNLIELAGYVFLVFIFINLIRVMLQ